MGEEQVPVDHLPGVIEWEQLNKPLFYTISPLASLVTRFAVYPLNLVKTRIQMQYKKAMYSGTFDAFVKIVRTEGITKLHRGFHVNALAALNSQMYVTVYELVRAGMKDQPVYLRELAAGGLSSFLAQTVAVPIDIVSQSLMLQGQGGAKETHNARSLVRQIYATEGLRGFFRGYVASILTFTPSSAIWWLAYSYVRRLQIGDSGNVAHISFERNLANQAIAGGIAGATAAIATNPIDILRTRIQTRRSDEKAGSNSLVSVFRQLHREEGMLFEIVSF